MSEQPFALAFYKACKGNWKDWAINIWTGLHGYSHCEIMFTDGQCFSASPREDSCRFKEISDIQTSGKWTIVPLSTSIYNEALIRTAAQEHIGKKYDWLGIFLHEFLPLNVDDNDKWWCSEICAFLLKQRDYKVSPNYLAKKLGV
jgi:hypothetical protein